MRARATEKARTQSGEEITATNDQKHEKPEKKRGEVPAQG